MSVTEHALQFACAGDALVGVLSAPDRVASAPTGVIIVVGGPQVRCGSHRQFTLLARHLSAAGYPVLRFDVRGMGDSSGAQRSFEELGDDIAAAIHAMQQTVPSVQQVVLWGLCDGASAALLYLDGSADARVAGLCLLNPWVRSDASLARTHVKHYYTRRLMQGAFWRKLLGGGVARRAIAELISNLRTARARPPVPVGSLPPFQRRMARAWAAFDGPLLLLLSGNDYTAREFGEHAAGDAQWRANLAHPRLTRIDLDGADHTFSKAQDQQRVEAATLDWLNGALLAASRATHADVPATTHSAEHA